LQRAYTFTLMFVAVALPLSNAMMSVATGLLGMLWLVDCARNLSAARWRSVFDKNAVSVGLIGLYLLHVVGLAWTQDWGYGLHDLRVKLPLLALGLAGAFSLGFSGATADPAARDRILKAFLFAVLAALAGLVLNAAFFSDQFSHGRQVSVYISHVRFGMMLSFSVVVARYLAASSRWWLAVLLVVIAGLWWMQAVTGFALLAVLAPWWALPRNCSQRLRFRSAMIGGAALVLGASMLLKVGPGFADEPLRAANLPTHSAAGEHYVHMDGSYTRENGHWVWASVAWGELASAWNERSEMPFNGENIKGKSLSGPLIRFLASKGQPKDAVGVASLTAEEIAAIERGVPSIVELHGSGLIVRWNRFQFAWGRWRDGQGVQGSSALQRAEHLRAAWTVISTHPWFGVGTGDVRDATASAYQQMDSGLAPAFQHRAHNQYLALWEAFGVIGFLALLGWLILAARRGLQEGADGLLLPFIALVAVSFLTQDTLETQSGVTLVAWGVVVLSAWRSKGSHRNPAA